MSLFASFRIARRRAWGAFSTVLSDVVSAIGRKAQRDCHQGAPKSVDATSESRKPVAPARRGMRVHDADTLRRSRMVTAFADAVGEQRHGEHHRSERHFLAATETL